MHEIHNFRLYYYRSRHNTIIDCHCTASIITSHQWGGGA